MTLLYAALLLGAVVLAVRAGALLYPISYCPENEYQDGDEAVRERDLEAERKAKRDPVRTWPTFPIPTITTSSSQEHVLYDHGWGSLTLAKYGLCSTWNTAPLSKGTLRVRANRSLTAYKQYRDFMDTAYPDPGRNSYEAFIRSRLANLLVD